MESSVQRTVWQIQRDVIHAMLVREMKTRFGKWRLGYVWVLLEPSLHMMVLVTIFSLVRENFYPGIPTALFMLSGIAPFLCFSHCFGKGLTAIEPNRGLFNYRQLRPFDAVLTRTLLEFAIYLVALTCLLGLLAWFGVSTRFNNFLLLVVVNLLFFCFCLGLSLALCVVGQRFPEAAKMSPIIVRSLYFLSGVFFSLEQIPEEYHPYLVWNPLLHVIELTREGLFVQYQGAFGNLNYLIFISVSFLAFGLLTYRANWRDLVRSQ
ncbi:ABC transporter permease [Microbulbifer sp. MLAF003]|uniref:ABC transporter permease n=1 Tax=Microbulbifer TaxID=48073 RepID=UPI000367D31A|nr:MULTISPECIES: ABC transporter permease [Microbulbifer]WHI50432.1 ABC transporter permease [Microbulbifer sp. MLAF003]